MFPTFKTKEEIPAGFIEDYEERDGEWHPKLPGAPEADGLKSALEKERKARADAEKTAKETAARIAELEREAKAKEAGLTSEEVKKFREDAYKEIRAEIAADLEERDRKLAEATAAVRAMKLDNRVKELALKNGVRPDVVDDWWRLNSDAFELSEDDQPTVKDGKGKPVDKYIGEDLKKARPYLYEGTKAQGGGGGSPARPGIGSVGTSAEDILRNPSAALQAARGTAA